MFMTLICMLRVNAICRIYSSPVKCEMDVRSSSQVDIDMICNGCIYYFAEEPTTVSLVLKLALRGWNTGDDEQESLAGVDRLQYTVWSSEEQVRSLQPQVRRILQS